MSDNGSLEQHGTLATHESDEERSATPVDDNDSVASTDDKSDAEDEPGYDADANAEEEPEYVYIPLTTADIPALLEDLTSSDEDIFFKATMNFGELFERQPDFIAENLAALNAPGIVEIMKSTALETGRYNLVSILSSFPQAVPEAYSVLLPLIPDLIALMPTNDVVTSRSLLKLVEELLEKDPSSEAIVLSSLRLLYEPVELLKPEDQQVDMDNIVNLVEILDHLVLFGEPILQNLVIRAGGFHAVTSSARLPSSKVKIAVGDCLSRMLGDVDAIQSSLPDDKKEEDIVELIVQSALYLLEDLDNEVFTKGLEFIGEDRGEYQTRINATLANNPRFIRNLILGLAKKPPNTLNNVDFTINKLYEDEQLKPVALECLRDISNDDTISNETILKFIRGLTDSFLDARKFAFEAGFLGCILRRIDNASGEEKVKLMRCFDTLLEQEQLTGGYLLKTAGVLDRFVDDFASNSAEVRELAASILSRTLDSYLDGVSQQGLAVAQLSNPNTLPRILALIHVEDSKTKIAGLNLLSDILATEDGSASWSYEAESGKPPPPTPLKDQIVTGELATYVLNLFRNKVTAVAALRLLCQFCWGNKRGQGIVKAAFEPIIPDADVFFFASLYGDFVSRHDGRQKRHVADAAVAAGAIPRIEALLEQEHDDPEALRAAVEGYRVLLAAPSLDGAAIGRRNRALPSRLARLVGDGNIESLLTVSWMVRLIHDDDSNCYSAESWKDFATPETAKHLINWVNLRRENVERPVEEEMDPEAFQKADKEYDTRTNKINEAFENVTKCLCELLTNLAGLLKPYISDFFGPLFLRATDPQDYTVFEVINKYGALLQGDEPPRSLQDAIKSYLKKGPTPTIDECDTIVRHGGVLATAFYIEGYSDRIIANLQSKGDTECDSSSSLQALYIFIPLLPSRQYKDAIRKAFFASNGAVEKVAELIRSDHYTAFQAAEGLRVLIDDYPEGVSVLQEANIYDALLKLWSHSDLVMTSSEKAVGYILGALSHLDPKKLTDVVSTHIAQLTPPADQAGDEGKKKGGKKGKKKYKPKIAEEDVWARLAALANSTSAARQLLLETEPVMDFVKNSTESKTDETCTAAFLLLASVVQEKIPDGMDPILSQVATRFANEDGPLLSYLLFVSAFIPERVSQLVDAGVQHALLKCLWSFPTIGDFDALEAAVVALFETGAGYPAAVAETKSSLDGDEPLVYEKSWGHSFAFRRLLLRGDVKPIEAIVEAGAIGYALRLIKEDDHQLFVKGAALAGDLALSPHTNARAPLVELGCLTAIEEGHARLLQAYKAEIPSGLPEEEADEARSQKQTLKGYIPVVETAVKLIKGENVPDYTPELGL